MIDARRIKLTTPDEHAGDDGNQRAVRGEVTEPLAQLAWPRRPERLDG